MIHRRGLFAFVALLFAAMLTAAPATAKGFASSRITVTVEGEGKDVILIPGLSSSPRVWTEMIAATPGYRWHKVLVHGFAGTGKGGNAEGNVAAPVAEEIARYIAEQKLGPVAVIGHSMGGTMGMMLAARHPASVSKLMVVDMFPFMGAMFGGPNATPETLKPIAEGIMTSMRTAPEDAYAKRLEQTIASMVATESMRAGALEDSMKSDRDVAARAYGELVMTNLMPELPKVTAKTLVLYVTPRGAPVTDAQIDGYYQASYAPLKGATLKRVPDAAHFLMWDNAPFFQNEVKAFLAE
ncbi:alpha/beta hydrolase [Sphingomonas koreensis]|jgi:pimeloyl-ACP methyl ester carboxylesterase|uniref:Alpha/beta hydrolase n=2 Tax=Sphingomonas koreensis TaxID=93064 RepID=A0A2M8WHA4_9SPHN|nr:alpha/beta hydrolase [Sphingomonas koreensis]MDC7809130.1 alpha/beta hydrolase [Sphingomonas koreensis]PJI90290.1 pimeloyl-ACP methyl ester carboxylesterase [Sphingomonas koreensis]RSU18779.1 alpha/beta hydrolase [Sphingomonas koreensis]RSU25556.1 alpha/beta hydrolase [Sphingomonas koreensis]RSU25709.1 alpha/beta hydrolase [Sphingomonas koreensis]